VLNETERTALLSAQRALEASHKFLTSGFVPGFMMRAELDAWNNAVEQVRAASLTLAKLTYQGAPSASPTTDGSGADGAGLNGRGDQR
jgi:hypothetical protein